MAQASGSAFCGSDLDGTNEKLPYLKKLGVTVLHLNLVFKAPSMHKYDTEDYRYVDPQFGGNGASLRLRHNTQQLGMRLVLDGVFNHSGDSHAWSDRHNRDTGGACHNPESPRRDQCSFSDNGTAFSQLGYASLLKLDYQSKSLVNEAYRGEDSIIRHWLKAPWNMDDQRLDVMYMLGEADGVRNNLQYVTEIIEATRETQLGVYIVGEHFDDARQWLQADVEDVTMNYRDFAFPLWGFLINTNISYDSQQIDAQTHMIWMDNYCVRLSHQQQLCMFNQLDNHDIA